MKPAIASCILSCSADALHDAQRLCRQRWRAFIIGLILCASLYGESHAAVLPLEATEGRLNPDRVEIVAQDSFPNQKGVALKTGAAPSATAGTTAPTGEPDLVLPVQAPKPGRYNVTTFAATDAAGTKLMRMAKTKFDSLFMWFQIDDRRPTRRVVFVPWGKPELVAEHTGIFEFSGGEQQIRLWLPAGVRLHRLELSPYKAPPVPQEASAYRPPVAPPAAHPRLWVTEESLVQVRANLTHPENRPCWDRVSALAAEPFVFKAPGDGEVPYNTPLERAALAKAFVFLMRGDQRIGREAVDLMLAYLPRVEFGNVLDITREIGAAIYTGSCVYDWCHKLLKPAERDILRRHLTRLAEEMECGWPPFRQSIINGHGNEAQINRDLLAMAIAVHDEDPLPYQYCAYAVLEQLVPMRRFEYQSPRHNQGISYGAYRFAWEMHAAWLFRRMTGREVFDPNIKRVPLYWLHFRLPDGEMLRDGDGVPASKYWSYARTALLCSAYNGDPILKGELQRQGGLMSDPVLFLLLNDPSVVPEPRLDSLPLTMDFGSVLGGMVARTGWTMGPDSPDVVAAIRGGGHHFGNHLHADAGAIQIYYRGLQVGPLAQYGFYGTPYDQNFAKRSVAQSMVLVFDPKESIPRDLANDGGTRHIRSFPRTPKQAMTDPMFDYGTVRSCSFGPDLKTPDFSYFAADLRAAYSDKITAYVRRFCFLNLRQPGHPAAMILLDDVTAKDPGFRKTWQLTTVQDARTTPAGVRIGAGEEDKAAALDVRMLLPTAGARTLDILSGAEVFRVAGKLYTPPKADAPEARGRRIVVTPKDARTHDRFLCVLQPGEGEPLAVAHEEGDGFVTLRIADRVVVLATGATPLDRAVEITVPASEKPWQVWLAGLAAGDWRITGPDAPERKATVAAEKNTLTFITRGGLHRISR